MATTVIEDESHSGRPSMYNTKADQYSKADSFKADHLIIMDIAYNLDIGVTRLHGKIIHNVWG